LPKTSIQFMAKCPEADVSCPLTDRESARNLLVSGFSHIGMKSAISLKVDLYFDLENEHVRP